MNHKKFITTTTDRLHQEFVEKLASSANKDANENLEYARQVVYKYYPAIHQARIEELRTEASTTDDPRLKRALELQIKGYEEAVDRVKETVARLKKKEEQEHG